MSVNTQSRQVQSTRMSTQEKEALMIQNEQKIEEMTLKIIEETVNQE